jgi:hypothetical protein
MARRGRLQVSVDLLQQLLGAENYRVIGNGNGIVEVVVESDDLPDVSALPTVTAMCTKDADGALTSMVLPGAVNGPCTKAIVEAIAAATREGGRVLIR